MKKILSLLVITLLSFSLVACSSTDTKEPVKEEVKKEELTLSDADIKTIKDELTSSCTATAFEGAKFEVKLNKNELSVSVIKNVNDIMKGLNTTTADDTVEAIKKSLTFDTAYETINKDNKYNCLQVFIFTDEEAYKNNDYYTLKTIF